MPNDDTFMTDDGGGRGRGVSKPLTLAELQREKTNQNLAYTVNFCHLYQQKQELRVPTISLEERLYKAKLTTRWG